MVVTEFDSIVDRDCYATKDPIHLALGAGLPPFVAGLQVLDLRYKKLRILRLLSTLPCTLLMQVEGWHGVDIRYRGLVCMTMANGILFLYLLCVRTSLKVPLHQIQGSGHTSTLISACGVTRPGQT